MTEPPPTAEPLRPVVRSRRTTALALANVVLAGACWGLAAVIARTAFDRGILRVRMPTVRAETVAVEVAP